MYSSQEDATGAFACLGLVASLFCSFLQYLEITSFFFLQKTCKTNSLNINISLSQQSNMVVNQPWVSCCILICLYFSISFWMKSESQNVAQNVCIDILFQERLFFDHSMSDIIYIVLQGRLLYQVFIIFAFYSAPSHWQQCDMQINVCNFFNIFIFLTIN